jgi:hypothetical protein
MSPLDAQFHFPQFPEERKKIQYKYFLKCLLFSLTSKEIKGKRLQLEEEKRLEWNLD